MLALPLPRGAGHPAAQPRTVTDAVVMVWGQTLLDPGIDPIAFAEESAPLVLVGGDRAPAALRNSAAALVSAPGAHGERLREALRYCLEREQATLASTPPPPARAGYQAYLQFFNHELRTPLTAAHMALEAASRSIEGCPHCVTSLELIDRALRNLQRLQRTVDWAGDFVQGAVTGPADDTASSVADLLEDLDQLEAPFPLTWEADLDLTSVAEVGRQNWRRVLRQVVQAVHYFRPSVAVHAAVGVSAETAQLTVQMRLAGDIAPGRVNRTGLSDPVDVADELRRLLTFTISPGLLSSMHARLCVEGKTQLQIRLELPLAEQPVPV
jgi:signal transduction histidine kinase